MTEEDYEEYGVVLQEIIQRLLGGTEAAGLPNTCFIRQNLCSLRLMYSKQITLTISFLFSTRFVTFQRDRHNSEDHGGNLRICPLQCQLHQMVVLNILTAETCLISFLLKLCVFFSSLVRMWPWHVSLNLSFHYKLVFGAFHHISESQ